MAFSPTHLLAALSLVVIAAVPSCTPRPNGPEPVAETFFAALSTGDTSGAAALSDRPDDARTALNAAWAGLQADHVDAQVLGSSFDEDTGSVNYRYTWHLPKNRTWTYDGQLSMIREEGRWLVRWTPAGVHPKLGVNQTVSLRADPPPTATVEAGGSDVLHRGYLYKYQLDAVAAGPSLMPSARALVDTLRPFDPSLDNPQRLAEKASSSAGPLDLVTLQPEDHDRVAPVLDHLPGVVASPQADLLPTDRGFAPAVVTEVKKQVMNDLDGQAGWRIVTVNQYGADVGILHEVPGVPAASVSLTLDRAVQNAAQGAVNTTGKKAMIVVIRPSTGEILAIAQNIAADAEGPLATSGLFPPGSTFKIVTAGAAIERDMARPSTLLGCPGNIEIGDRSIPNYGGFDLGVVPMARAFASSCNTTFAELASRMPPRALTDAAAQYGIGPDYVVPGLVTMSGSVPPTVNLTERTEDGFGQGKVLVSPFGLALAAATVAAGRTPVPQLIKGRETVITGNRGQIPPQILDGLRDMMRLVVTNGTAEDLSEAGDVRGKTGEAEFDGGSHSWFAGYRGDMAFAALIVGGGSSEWAVRMCRDMLDGLPPDYPG